MLKQSLGVLYCVSTPCSDHTPLGNFKVAEQTDCCTITHNAFINYHHVLSWLKFDLMCEAIYLLSILCHA